MTDFYSQNRCVCSTRSHGPLLCAFCLTFHFNDFSQSSLAFNFISYADDTTLLSTLGNFNNTGSNVERDNLINSEL